MAWSVEDIRKKLQGDPDWEPTDADSQDDPDFWTKFDEAMDSINAPVSAEDGDGEDFEDDDFSWDDDDEDW